MAQNDEDFSNLFKKNKELKKDKAKDKEAKKEKQDVGKETKLEKDSNEDFVNILTLELKTIIKEATDRAIGRLDWMPNFDMELFEVPYEELVDYAKNCEDHIGCLEEAITELQGVLRNQYKDDSEDEEGLHPQPQLQPQSQPQVPSMENGMDLGA